MGEMMKKILRSRLIMAIIAIVFGIILILRQRAALDSMVKIMGIILLVTAVIYILMFVFSKEKQGYQVVSAVVSGVIGLIFVLRPDIIVNIFPILMGIAMILSGIADLAQAMALKQAGAGGSAAFFILSLVVIVFGVLVLLHPGAIANVIALFVGITLLLTGIFNLILLIAGRVSM